MILEWAVKKILVIIAVNYFRRLAALGPVAVPRNEFLRTLGLFLGTSKPRSLIV